MADISTIRALLHQDRYWSLYALGDLDPRRQAHCQWHVRGSSVALLYREFETPILFAAGASDVVDEVSEVDACLLQIPEGFLTDLQRRFEVQWTCPVLRLALDPRRFVGSTGATIVEPLGVANGGELRELYADGDAAGEAPDFFMPSQLDDDTFFGIRMNGRLVAAGGTHLFSSTERVAAIGNVYTRRSDRGRGYAPVVMRAIIERLLERHTETIGLNVRVGNTSAIRIYERLGFTCHARFLEGRAIRR
jgi:ribosomal protein S18 acetylase RimI-like enzyme